MEDPTSKVCSLCRVEKPFAEYHKQPKGKFGLKSRCRDCENAKSRQFRQTNAEYYKRYYHNKIKPKVRPHLMTSKSV